jgi:hypothetical protein
MNADERNDASGQLVFKMSPVSACRIGFGNLEQHPEPLPALRVGNCQKRTQQVLAANATYVKAVQKKMS